MIVNEYILYLYVLYQHILLGFQVRIVNYLYTYSLCENMKLFQFLLCFIYIVYTCTHMSVFHKGSQGRAIQVLSSKLPFTSK